MNCRTPLGVRGLKQLRAGLRGVLKLSRTPLEVRGLKLCSHASRC